MGSEFPEISHRPNGDRLIGFADLLAERLYAAGTPPVHGLSDKAGWIADVTIGDRLQVQRIGDRWEITDARGRLLGFLRWRPTDDGRRHATTGVVVRLPASGTLHVRRLVVDSTGKVRDIGGYVEPAEPRSVGETSAVAR